MELKAFMQKYNSGNLDLADDLSKSDIKRGGGVSNFVDDLKTLAPQDQELVMEAIKDYGQRDEIEQAQNPDLNKLVKEFDKGHPFFFGLLHPGKKNYDLDAKEIAANGGFAKFFEGVAKLSDEERKRLSAMVNYDVVASPDGAKAGQTLPDLTNLNSFGTVKPSNKQDFQKAEDVRNFLKGQLEINPFGITKGLSATDLPAVKDGVAATSTEQFVLDTQKQLSADRKLNVLEFYGFMKANYPKTPCNRADVLATAMEADPKRFNGREMDVMGFPKTVSTNKHCVVEKETLTDAQGHVITDSQGHPKTIDVYRPVADVQYNIFGARDKTGESVTATIRYESTKVFSDQYMADFDALIESIPTLDKNTQYRFHGSLECDADDCKLNAKQIVADGSR
jgi:hypothetical protein